MKTKSLFVFISVLSLAPIYAKAKSVYECVGHQDRKTIIVDLIEARSTQHYIKVSSTDDSLRFFLVNDVEVGSSTTFSGLEVDPRSGFRLSGKAVLRVPRILQNKGQFVIEGHDEGPISVKCSSSASNGEFHI